MTSQPAIPNLGLGTFGRTGEEGIAAILMAIEIGYRHIDTAQSYNTEAEVGQAIQRSGLKRSEVFITTKVADTNLSRADFLPSVRKSIDTIGVGAVDLLLIHWPSENDAVPFEDYMLALKQAQDDGLARLIGVSNYPIALLERSRALLGKAALSTNQVEIHPYLQSPKLRDYARSVGLTLTAYQPLAKATVTDDPVLQRIAMRHGASPAAIAIAFLIAEGHIPIPASSSETNLRANFAALQVALSDTEVQEIRGLDRGTRRIDPAKSPQWDDR